MQSLILLVSVTLAAGLASVGSSAFAAEAAGAPLAPGALQRSIEGEARQLALALPVRGTRSTNAAQESPAAGATKTRASTGKIVAVVAGIAALATGTYCLAYGYSDACQANNPTDPGICQLNRDVGLSAIMTGAAFLPIALRLK